VTFNGLLDCPSNEIGLVQIVFEKKILETHRILGLHPEIYDIIFGLFGTAYISEDIDRSSRGKLEFVLGHEAPFEY